MSEKSISEGNESASHKNSDLEILDEVLTKLRKNFPGKPKDVKVIDIVRVIELKTKLKMGASEGMGEKAFWAMVNTFRSRELSRGEIPRAAPPEADQKGEANNQPESESAGHLRRLAEARLNRRKGDKI